MFWCFHLWSCWPWEAGRTDTKTVWNVLNIMNYLVLGNWYLSRSPWKNPLTSFLCSYIQMKSSHDWRNHGSEGLKTDAGAACQPVHWLAKQASEFAISLSPFVWDNELVYWTLMNTFQPEGTGHPCKGTGSFCLQTCMAEGAAALLAQQTPCDAGQERQERNPLLSSSSPSATPLQTSLAHGSTPLWKHGCAVCLFFLPIGLATRER